MTTARSLSAQIAANSRWAHEPDRRAATEAMRRGQQEKFERDVDPEGILSPQERTRRADSARKAHMLRMSLASKKARASRKTSSAQEDNAVGIPLSTADVLDAPSAFGAVQIPSGPRGPLAAVEPEGFRMSEAMNRGDG